MDCSKPIPWKGDMVVSLQRPFQTTTIQPCRCSAKRCPKLCGNCVCTAVRLQLLLKAPGAHHINLRWLYPDLPSMSVQILHPGCLPFIKTGLSPNIKKKKKRERRWLRCGADQPRAASLDSTGCRSACPRLCTIRSVCMFDPH